MSQPASYYQQQPPGQGQGQGQGYRHPDPKIGGGGQSNRQAPQHAAYDRDGYPIPPSAPQPAGGAYDPSYFPPPPRSEYGSAGRYENERPRGQREAPRGDEEGDGNAMTPYDEEKAWAQYNDAYGPPQQEHDRRPAPPASAAGGYDRRYDEARYVDRPRYDEREDRHRSRPPHDDDYERYRDGPQPRREDDYVPRKQRSPTAPSSKGGKDFLRQGDGERGLGATLLGGAAGAFLGDQAEKGILGTVGGAVLGAIAANAGEKQLNKRKGEKEARKKYQDEYASGGAGPYQGSRGPSRVDEFRPRREPARPRGQRRRGEASSTDSYSSDD